MRLWLLKAHLVYYQVTPRTDSIDVSAGASLPCLKEDAAHSSKRQLAGAAVLSGGPDRQGGVCCGAGGWVAGRLTRYAHAAPAELLGQRGLTTHAMLAR